MENRFPRGRTVRELPYLHGRAAAPAAHHVVVNQRRRINLKRMRIPANESTHIDGFGQILKALLFERANLCHGKTALYGHIAHRNAFGLSSSPKHRTKPLGGSRRFLTYRNSRFCLRLGSFALQRVETRLELLGRRAARAVCSIFFALGS